MDVSDWVSMLATSFECWCPTLMQKFITNIDVTALKPSLGSKLKTIKVTFCQKAEEYYRDINDYKGDWPGIKFSSSLQCKFPCNLNVHALFLLSYCPLSYQYAYISSKSGILKIAVFE